MGLISLLHPHFTTPRTRAKSVVCTKVSFLPRPLQVQGQQLLQDFLVSAALQLRYDQSGDGVPKCGDDISVPPLAGSPLRSDFATTPRGAGSPL